MTERFTALARATMLGRGLPNQPAVVLPGNPEFVSASELAALAEQALDRLVAEVAPVAVRRPTAPA